MYIASIKIKSYKSFHESDEIIFNEGINLIVGVNNSGKTALLEALSLKIKDNPYRNNRDNPTNIKTTYHISKDKIKEQIQKGNFFIMPFPDGSADPIFDMFYLALDSYLEVTSISTAKNSNIGFIYKDLKNSKFIHSNNNHNQCLKISDFVNERHTSNAGIERSRAIPTPEKMIEDFIGKFFFFNSERMNLHTCNVGRSRILLSDARNLPEVINSIASSEYTYKKYLSLVRRVLPDVKYISSELEEGNGKFTIKIRTCESTEEDEELRFPLSDCGTGVGQILAILYVLTTSKEPSVIIIDEPNSFLHPSATKELIKIFKENPQHQYFISTHSPEVFAEVKPKSYTELSYENGQTIAKTKEFGEIGNTYQALGISPFFDFALWVEGETEELAFPYILDNPNIQIHKFSVSDVITSKSSKREIDRLIEIYENVLKAKSGEPVISKMKIVVDGEHLTSKNIEDYERRPDKLVNFLPRKMFENYLLDAEAIANVLSMDLDFEVSTKDIANLLDESRKNKNLQQWLTEVHGSKLLAEIFSKYSCEFKKTTHSVELTKLLVSKTSKDILELKKTLLSITHK